jgi:hypothetical protein
MWYGYKLRFKTPEFGDEKHGISSWRTRSDKAEWEAGNKFAGLLCMSYAVFLAVIAVAKYLIAGDTVVMAFNYGFGGVTLVCIFSLVPLTHSMLAKRFGKREFVSDNPGFRNTNKKSAKNSGKKNNKKKSKKK